MDLGIYSISLEMLGNLFDINAYGAIFQRGAFDISATFKWIPNVKFVRIIYMNSSICIASCAVISSRENAILMNCK